MANPATKTDRIQKIRTMLEKTPNDAFLLYALGMEHKEIDVAQALQLFHQVIQIDPDHGYAYYQLGQTHELAGEKDAAATAYQNGMSAARRRGDNHAAQEIAAALEMLEEK